MHLRVEFPPQLALLDQNFLHGIVHLQEVVGGESEGFQQDRRRHLPPAVNPNIDDVADIKLEIQPGTAIGDDARRIQNLPAGVRPAFVVGEKRARRAMKLTNYDALGAVNNKGAAVGHQRQFSDVHLLFAYIQHLLVR